MSSVLSKEELHRFLRRRRRGGGVVRPLLLGRLLAETLELGVRLVPVEAATLLLDDPALRRLAGRRKASLTFVAAHGPGAARLVGLELPGEVGVVGRVYATGETCTAPEQMTRRRRQERGSDERVGFAVRSVVATPIRLEQTVCGVLELVNRRGRKAFSARDVELVELLGRYISRAITNAVDVLKHNELLRVDELTGALNVRLLHHELEQALRRAQRVRAGDLAVLFVDVDRLKRLNDQLGHHAGSEALRRVGEALRMGMPPSAKVYRFGGDEFVVVAPVDVREARAIASRAMAEVKRQTPGAVDAETTLPEVTVSIGVATLRHTFAGRRTATVNAQGLLQAADRALYRAKRGGRARSVVAGRRRGRTAGSTTTRIDDD